MNREDIEKKLLEILIEEFEMEDPGLDDNLREVHGFDSIDAIELLGHIELILGYDLTQEEKKLAMDIKTINDICDYVLNIHEGRS